MLGTALLQEGLLGQLLALYLWLHLPSPLLLTTPSALLSEFLSLILQVSEMRLNFVDTRGSKEKHVNI